MAGVSYLVAFLAGIVSFLAPCVLPLVPGFLIYLAGHFGQGGIRKAVGYCPCKHSLCRRVLACLLPPWSSPEYDTELSHVRVQLWLSRAGGLIIIFFGLYLVGLIRIGWLEQEHKFSVTGIKSKYLTSFVFGAAFAAGWTPCVGAALGAILGLAATQPGIAFTLLLAYSAGLGVPFIITGLFASQAVGWISKYSRVLHYVNIVFGILLIVIGILIFTQTLSLIANLPELNGFLLGS